MADALVDKAHKLASDPNFKSPYSVGLEKSGNLPLIYRFTGIKGGKMDDCSAIVGIVAEKA